MRWLVLGQASIPADLDWLTPVEVAHAVSLRYTKRRTEFLLRRLTAKTAVAMVTGLTPQLLNRIEVRHVASGAPYILIDGARAGLSVSITDRAGWAACLIGAGTVGVDLELVEPRSVGFIRDFLTDAEQELVAAAADRHAVATLLWSAKESALKALRTGLRRDPRSAEVRLGGGGVDGWRPLTVRAGHGPLLPGWWRRDGCFLLTAVSRQPLPPPLPLAGSSALASATPDHAWLDHPLTPA